jgi:hypothetical protein
VDDPALFAKTGKNTTSTGFFFKKEERSVGFQRMGKSREIHWKKVLPNGPLFDNVGR